MSRQHHAELAVETVEPTALETGLLPDAAAPADRAALRQGSAETPRSAVPVYNRVGSGRFLRASLALWRIVWAGGP